MLTEEQIQSLFIFCEKHFVKYYDVQVELVDHLANAIEARIDADPNLSFEKALGEVHESFGVMGFAPLVSEKTKIAEKQSRRLFWGLFKAQFRWPKILLFLLLSSSMFTLFSTNVILGKWIFIFLLFASCLFNILQTLKISRRITRTGKKFLITGLAQASPLGWIFFDIFYFPRIFDNDFLKNTDPVFPILFASLFISVFVIIVIVISQTLTSVRKTLFNNYPEVFSYGK